MPHTGPWTISDLKKGRVGNKKNGMSVFTCFHCGGGSSFGYKLAGFDVVGGVEIDPKMMEVYRHNHNPKHSFLMGIQKFNKLPKADIPYELFDLDILDGSPPCSSFSMAGSREKAWGKEKKFREGQAMQVLDDLFADFIETAKLLRPKMVISENVKGLVAGSARGYVKTIFDKFSEAGYDTQLFLLNASRMGVPQARERVFFVSRRRDLNIPKIVINCEEAVVSCETAFKGLINDGSPTSMSEKARLLWSKTMPGDSFAKRNNGSWFNWIRLDRNSASPTLPATCRLTHFSEPRFIAYNEAVRLQSFPDDYDFMGHDARYICGMSVPPLMAMRVAEAATKALTSIHS